MSASALLHLFGCVTIPALLAPASHAAEGPKYPHMHHALYELAESRKELKEAAHDFGGHREKALKDVDEAIVQMEKALEAAGDKYVPRPPEKDVYKKYEFHPHIHHALHELAEARKELKEAGHDFGGHREKSLEKVDHAIKQLELALKFDRR
jgi:tetratricopeptide (TPR) repeat protein